MSVSEGSLDTVPSRTASENLHIRGSMAVSWNLVCIVMLEVVMVTTSMPLRLSVSHVEGRE
jgi:hypothetical protein